MNGSDLSPEERALLARYRQARGGGGQQQESRHYPAEARYPSYQQSQRQPQHYRQIRVPTARGMLGRIDRSMVPWLFLLASLILYLLAT